MSKIAVCLLFLVCASQAQKSINLRSEDLLDANKKYANTVHYFEPLIGEGPEGTKTIFDSTTYSNYLYVSLPQSATAFAGLQGNLKVANEQKIPAERITINDEKLKDIKFTDVVPNTASLYSKEKLGAGFGLAFPASGTENFLDQIVSKGYKIEKKGFSFFFSDKVSQIYLGSPQEFFASSELTKIKLDPASPQWQLKVDKILIGNTAIAPATTKTAKFDTTTEFITVDDDTQARILSALTESGITLASQTPFQTLQCSEGEKHLFINFQFSGETNVFSVKLRDLLRKNGEGSEQCVLLIAKGGNGDWTLGTSFLRSVYTYFNQDAKTISLANAEIVEVQKRTLDSTWRISLIIVGIVLIAGALTILVNTITPLPHIPPQFKPNTQSSQPPQFIQFQPQQQQVPRVYQTIPQQQQQLAYSQVVGNSLRASSPQRITQAQPGQIAYRQGF